MAPRRRQQRNQVFISYSHADVAWLKRLQVHLKPLERDGNITRWDDTLIKPGAPWREEIRAALARAKVAVLLVSADFLASDFITTDELPPLLAAAQRKGTLILPIIVSPSRFEQTPALSRFQSVNPPSQPLLRLRRAGQEDVFVAVSGRIAEVLAPPAAADSPAGPRGGRKASRSGGHASRPPSRRASTKGRETSIQGYALRVLDSGSIEIRKDGDRIAPAKPVLRSLAVDLGVSLLNANGNPRNTRQLGQQVIQRAGKPDPAAPVRRRT